MAELAGWDSFYLIVGTAAGALIGLQFVVLTILVQRSLPKGAEDAGTALLTPAIHFGVLLLLSAHPRVPWPGIDALALFIFIMGFIGAPYTGIVEIVAFHLRRQRAYLREL